MQQEEIRSLKAEIQRLKAELEEKERQLNRTNKICKYSEGLSTSEVTRYSRQMLVTEVGLNGQLNLKDGKVLIVGAGGLGCPAAVYLAGAGVGQITIVDYDDVELTNLHRQILHHQQDIDTPKVQSMATKLRSFNRDIEIIPIKQHMDRHSVKRLLERNKYDVLIDGSDNVATRYLLNDACVLYKVPLVSGSALQTDGQLTVYNYQSGPCYRCLFPVPPPPERVVSCGDGGVLGPVPGVIGVLQALQAIKILTGAQGVLAGRLLLFDGATSTFRNVTLRSRNRQCAVCGDEPTIKELIDYEQFCGASAHDKVVNIEILGTDEMVDARQIPDLLSKKKLILDVRPRAEFEMCHLPNTCNVPFASFDEKETFSKQLILEGVDEEVYVLCRRGNDSQRAVKRLKEQFSNRSLKFVNIKGGLHAYSRDVDSDFPIY